MGLNPIRTATVRLVKLVSRLTVNQLFSVRVWDRTLQLLGHLLGHFCPSKKNGKCAIQCISHHSALPLLSFPQLPAEDSNPYPEIRSFVSYSIGRAGNIIFTFIFLRLNSSFINKHCSYNSSSKLPL